MTPGRGPVELRIPKDKTRQCQMLFFAGYIYTPQGAGGGWIAQAKDPQGAAFALLGARK